MQVDTPCKDIEQRCKIIREEIFRHLIVLESIESGLGQTSISNAVAAIAIFIALIGIGSQFLNPLSSLIAVVILIVFIIFSRKILPRVSNISKSIRMIIELHDKGLIKYMNRYEECCNELSNNCSKEYAIYCLDLEELKKLEELVKKL
jgi:hypothetical protein